MGKNFCIVCGDYISLVDKHDCFAESNEQEDHDTSDFGWVNRFEDHRSLHGKFPKVKSKPKPKA